MADPSKIRDIPSNAEMAKTVHGITALAKMVRFLEMLGIRNQAISDALQRFPSLAENAEKVVNLPDRFNDRFAARGWIAFESMNAEVIDKAIELADSGAVEAAEALLVDHFNEDTIRFLLLRLNAIPRFQPRWPLAIKALEDYLAERFHASVPVVLAIIDGFVNDIEQTGFFAATTNLTAWDSIAAHSTGLTRLREIFGTPRKKTTTDAISLPYRHGILHGRDLGYDNRLVAAKSWAALFAVGDWAFALRAGKKRPQPKPPEPSLFELLEKIAGNEQRKRLLAEWSPRALVGGVDYPLTGAPDKFIVNTPEHAVAMILDLWKQKNYGLMAALFKSFTSEPLGAAAGGVRRDFANKTIRGFCILEVCDKAPAICEIKAAIEFRCDSGDKMETIDIRLIYEDEQGEPAVFPTEKAAWKIMPYSFSPVICSL